MFNKDIGTSERVLNDQLYNISILFSQSFLSKTKTITSANIYLATVVYLIPTVKNTWVYERVLEIKQMDGFVF